MANIKSAKKRIRVIEKKTARNKRIKSRLKSILKDFDTAIEAGEQKEARQLLAQAEKKLMQAVAKGTVHKNNASRKISRLTTRFTKEFGVDALKENPEAKKSTETKAKKASTKKVDTPKDEKPEEKVEEKADDKEAEEPEKKAAPKKKSTKKESAEEAEATDKDSKDDK